MTRILTAAVLVPLVVSVVLYAPLWALLLVLALVGLIAYFEFDSIAAAHGFPADREEIAVVPVAELECDLRVGAGL